MLHYASALMSIYIYNIIYISRSSLYLSNFSAVLDQECLQNSKSSFLSHRDVEFFTHPTLMLVDTYRPSIYYLFWCRHVDQEGLPTTSKYFRWPPCHHTNLFLFSAFFMGSSEKTVRSFVRSFVRIVCSLSI